MTKVVMHSHRDLFDSDLESINMEANPKIKAIGIKLQAEDLNQIQFLINKESLISENIQEIWTQYLSKNSSIFISNCSKIISLKSKMLENTESLSELIQFSDSRFDDLAQNLHISISQHQLFSKEDRSEEAMIKMVHIILLFHDLIKKNPHQISNLEKNIELISDWLFNALAIPYHQAKELHQLMVYLTSLVIMGGTTKIQGIKRDMSFIEMYLLYEEEAKCQAGMHKKKNNHSFINSLKVITILTAIFYKNDRTSFDLIERSTQNSNRQIDPNQMTLLTKFFDGDNFKPYFLVKKDLAYLNQKAFLRLISSIFSFSKADHDHKAPLRLDYLHLAKFMIYCRLHQNHDDFKSIFNHAFQQQKIQKRIEHILKHTASTEAQLLQKQIDECRALSTKLIFLGLSHRSINGHHLCGSFQQMIQCDAFSSDLENILEMIAYYERLSAENKSTFIKELLLNEINRAGFISKISPKLFKKIFSLDTRKSKPPLFTVVIKNRETIHPYSFNTPKMQIKPQPLNPEGEFNLSL